MDMNITFSGGTRFFPALSMGGLKSAREKAERQQECENQIAYWEAKKENLKDIKCNSIEDVEKKLQLFHSYEDSIAAARESYNNSQMWHILDEAKEKAEKIAKEAEKLEPKTAEERQEDMAREAAQQAAGTEESEGVLSEMMEENTEAMEELTEEMQEEMAGEELEQTAGEQADSIEETMEEIMEEKRHQGIDIRI